MPLRPLLITHSSPSLHDAFLRFTPRVFPRFDFRPWYVRGGWTSAYASHALADESGEIVANVSAALWNVLAFHRKDVHTLAPGVHVVAVQRGDVLDLVDVAAPARFDLLAALPRLVRAPISRVRFGFCPEVWCPSARAVGPSDDALFVRDPAAPGPEPFKLPALAQT
jgi:hypothetical protein